MCIIDVIRHHIASFDGYIMYIRQINSQYVYWKRPQHMFSCTIFSYNRCVLLSHSGKVLTSINKSPIKDVLQFCHSLFAIISCMQFSCIEIGLIKCMSSEFRCFLNNQTRRSQLINVLQKRIRTDLILMFSLEFY